MTNACIKAAYNNCGPIKSGDDHCLFHKHGKDIAEAAEFYAELKKQATVENIEENDQTGKPVERDKLSFPKSVYWRGYVFPTDETAFFYKATFEHEADFGSAIFEDKTYFYGTTFKKDADFNATKHNGSVSFYNATFKGKGSFFKALFRSGVNFEDTTFMREGQFIQTVFDHYVSFNNAHFERGTIFFSATFAGKASFRLTCFGLRVEYRSNDFSSAIFKKAADFMSANFKGPNTFSAAIFDSNALFDNAIFLRHCSFSKVLFKKSASFDKATFEHAAIFESVDFRDFAFFRNSSFKENANFKNAYFGGRVNFEDGLCDGSIDFSGALFNRLCPFSGRKFNGYIYFTNAEFRQGVVMDADWKNPDLDKYKLPQAEQQGCSVQKISYDRAGQNEASEAMFVREMRARRADRIMQYEPRDGKITCRKKPLWEKETPLIKRFLWKNLFSHLSANFEMVFVDWTSVYGTSWQRVIGTASIVIVFFAGCYYSAPYLSPNNLHIGGIYPAQPAPVELLIDVDYDPAVTVAARNQTSESSNEPIEILVTVDPTASAKVKTQELLTVKNFLTLL